MADKVLVTPSVPGNADWVDVSSLVVPPSGPAGGDLSGTYPNPTVDGIGGVSFTGVPALGDTIVFDGTNWVYQAPSGGITIIPDGGSISGTYTGPVLCLGDVTLGGNTVIEADLWTTGNLTTGGVFTLEVKGDMHASGDVTMSDAVDPTIAHYLIVYGGLYSQAAVDVNILEVYGPTAVNFLRTYSAFFEGPVNVATLNFDGRSNAFPDGGFVTAASLDCSTLTANGFDVSSADPNLRSGSGGNLSVYAGTLIVSTLTMRGGGRLGGLGAPPAGPLPAPNGGFIEVYGDINAGSLDLRGGSVSMSAPIAAHDAGGGGTVDCYGDMYIDISLIVRGGASNITAAATGSGGLLYCGGSTTANSIELTGGAQTTASGNGGSAGSISFNGPTSVNIIQGAGGAAVGTGTGGQGAFVFGDNAPLIVGTLNINGGAGAAGGVNGAGGLVSARRGANIQVLNATDGAGAGSQATNATTISLAGSCSIGGLGLTQRAVSPTNVSVYALTGQSPTTLTVNSFTGSKTTFNRDPAAASVATGNLAAAVAAGDSIFVAYPSTNSTWYRLTGVAV